MSNLKFEWIVAGSKTVKDSENLLGKFVFEITIICNTICSVPPPSPIVVRVSIVEIGRSESIFPSNEAICSPVP